MSVIEDIKQQKLKPCYLLCGEERYLLMQAVAGLKAYFDAEGSGLNTDILDAESCTLADCVRSAATASFFAECKLVLVQNVPWCQSGKSKKTVSSEDDEKTKNEEGVKGSRELPGLSELREYLDSPLPDVCLVFVANGTPDKRTAFYKELQKKAAVEEFAVPDRRAQSAWLTDRLAAEGKSFTPELSNMLLAACGDNIGVLESELQKIILANDDKSRITPADCEGIISPSLEISVFELIDAVSQKQGQKGIELFEEMLCRGEAVQKIAVLLFRQFHDMLATCDMKKRGFGQSDIKRELELRSDYVAAKLCRYASGFGTGELMHILDDCLTADQNAKNGIQSMEEALKDLILKISL